MTSISDFSDTEKWVVRSALDERWGHGTVELQLADVEVRLSASDRELTSCPAVYWEAQGCHFVLIKTGEQRYRSQFYYAGHEQYGTGIDEYSDLSECVLTLLRMQADHELARGLGPSQTK